MLTQRPFSRQIFESSSNLESSDFSAAEHGDLRAMGTGAWERNDEFSLSVASYEIGRAEVTKCSLAERPPVAVAIQRMTFSGQRTALLAKLGLPFAGKSRKVLSNIELNREGAESSDKDISQ